MNFYQDPSEKDSIKWGVVIGLGRMAQSNAKLRTECASLWVKECHSRYFRMRWAGIKGMGHASCPVGNGTNFNDYIVSVFIMHYSTSGSITTGNYFQLLYEYVSWTCSHHKHVYFIIGVRVFLMVVEIHGYQKKCIYVSMQQCRLLDCYCAQTLIVGGLKYHLYLVNTC